MAVPDLATMLSGSIDMRSEIKMKFDSIASKILAADMHEQPTPYLNLGDIFRPNFYAAMVKTVESCECYLDLAQFPDWQGNGSHYLLAHQYLSATIPNKQHQATRSNSVAMRLLLETAAQTPLGSIAQKFGPWIPEVADNTYLLI